MHFGRKTRARFFPQPPPPETDPFPTEIVTFLLHPCLHLSTDNFCRQEDRCRRIQLILGDPGADKGGEGKCKPAEKYIWNEEK